MGMNYASLLEHLLIYQTNYTHHSVNGLYSILGANYRVLCTKYDMNVNKVMNIWSEQCVVEEESVRVCEQVRECVKRKIGVALQL